MKGCASEVLGKLPGKVNDVIQRELLQVKTKLQEIENVELITCVDIMVQVRIQKTAMKQMVVCFQFPENYPRESVLIELKSKTLSQKLLHGLSNVLDNEAKKLTGQYQIIPLIVYVKKFMEDNPLCVCSEEISNIKAKLLGEQDELKLKQKTSQIILKTKEKDYVITAKFTVPEDYPKVKTEIKITESNLPHTLCLNLSMQCVEMARQCVEPPLKTKAGSRSHHPKPALFPITEYILTTMRRYPHEICRLCGDLCLPENPQNVVNDSKFPKFVERIYCSDLFHHDCIDAYMKTPPFQGGKKCPGCGKRIYHDKWHISPETAEARWAHKEARNRELDEVVDFLQ